MQHDWATDELEGSLTREVGLLANFSMSAPFTSGSHVLQDYQMRLMLLEQQNKMRLMMECQEQESTTLDRSDSSLLEPRVPPRRQSDLRHELFPLVPEQRSDLCHGLLTPRGTPHGSPSEAAQTPSNCPSPQASMSNAHALNPSLTGQIYNAPFYRPSTGVRNFPLLPHQSFQYSTNAYIPRPDYSFGYQEYQYPQKPQTEPFPIANVLRSDASTPVTLVLGVCASLEPNLLLLSMSSQDLLVSMESQFSLGSMGSTDSSKTYDTVDLEVPTPEGHWDEPPGLKDSSRFESKFKASTDQDFNFDDNLFTEPDFVEQSLTDCKFPPPVGHLA